MRRIKITCEVDQEQLMQMIKKGEQWSTRNRAQALLLVSKGYQAIDVAKMLSIHLRTVSRTVRSYNEQGPNGLICRCPCLN